MAEQPSSPMIRSTPKVQFVEDFFIYEVDFTGIAAAGTSTQNIQVQADSDFKLVKMAQMTDIAGAAQTQSTQVLPLATMQLTDSGSGRQLFSNPVPIPNIFGFSGLPFILPVPRIFKARTNISLTFANYSAATTYNFRLSLIGTKIFQLGPA